MRVVIDTNVIVSAALKDQSLPALAVHVVEKRDVLLKSLATERQLFDVLARPRFERLIAPASHAWLRRRLLTEVEMVTIAERIAACRDPTDDKFLELAANGRADVIVSGDADLFALDPFRGIPIVVPAVFVQGVAR
jgi:putative PIN family toxin of toxin-antitoxin system